MTNRLDEIRARLEKATPGPWHADTAQRGDCVVWGPVTDQFLANVGNVVSRVVMDGDDESQPERIVFDLEEANCEFVAHSRADLEWAVAEIERLRREADGLREEIRSANLMIEEMQYGEDL